MCVCVCLAEHLDRKTECFTARLSGDSCRTATQLTQLTTRTATCSFKRNYFGWWKEKNRLIQQQNLRPVSCCALKMQSGLQCVTHAAVGRRSQLPVKNEGMDAKRKRATLLRSRQDFIKEIESEYISKTSETSQTYNRVDGRTSKQAFCSFSSSVWSENTVFFPLTAEDRGGGANRWGEGKLNLGEVQERVSRLFGTKWRSRTDARTRPP